MRRQRIAVPLIVISLLTNVALGVIAIQAARGRADRATEARKASAVAADRFNAPVPADTGTSTVFLGDSLVRDAPVAELVSPFAQRGSGGMTVEGLRAWLAAAQRQLARRLVLLIGTNDVVTNPDPNTFGAQYDGLLTDLTRARTDVQVVVMAIPPERGPDARRIPPMNDKLASIAKARQLRYVDLFTPLVDTTGQLDIRWTYDGVHLNAAGYAAARPSFLAAVA